MGFSIREWATPLVAGAFVLSATTGVLIFFHLDSGLNKPAHEWLGWALVVGAATHVFSNFAGLKKRLQQPVGYGIVGVFVLILLLSFIPVGEKGDSPMRAGIDGLIKAPISVVAQVANKDVTVLMSDLKENGLEITSASQSIREASGGDMEKSMKALGTAFQK